MADIVKAGDNVTVEYEGFLDDNSVFDSGKIDVKVQSGQLIKGFDDALVGMKVDEEKTIHIAKEDAYGEYQDVLIQTVPKEYFGGKLEPKKDMILQLRNPTGHVMMAKILDFDEKTVKLDFNHPMAGKDLNFKIKIIEINE